jgi:PAS domain S-box-containing protein
MKEHQPRRRGSSQIRAFFTERIAPAGIGTENATSSPLSGSAERRFHQLRVLTDVSRALTAARSTDTVQRLAVVAAAEMLGTQKAVLLIGDDYGTLFVRATHGVCAEVVRRIRLPSDLTIDGRLQLAFGDKERAYLGIPLVVRGVLSGLLAVDCLTEPGGDGDGDEWVVSALADQTAVALDSLKTATPRQNDALFKLLVDSIDECAVVALDPNGCVETWSVGAEKMSGFSVAEIISQHIHALYVKADADPDSMVASALADGRHEREVLLSRKNGSTFWAKVLFVPMRDPDGLVCGYAHIIRDVSLRRACDERESQVRSEQAARIEANLERDRSQAINRMKDEFLATISHELRTPLSAIMGWAAILRDKRLHGDNLERGLEIIERNARSQVRLIEDILDVSRIISGKDAIRKAAVGVQKVVEAAVEAVQIAADKRGISLRAQFVDGLGLVVGDEERLQQVVSNLLSNALKFTPEGGAVLVRAERRDAEVLISVSDTGRGIAPAFLPFVFDRFRQGEDVTTRRSSGLGLGLAIVRHFVELHDGTVSASSLGAGQGTTMLIRLPVAAAVVDRVQSEERMSGAHLSLSASGIAGVKGKLRGVHVVVVDDMPDACEVVAAILQYAGATVATAGSGPRAMELLGEEPRAHVLIADVEMPEEDGYALIQRVRSSAHSKLIREIPALALSAGARAEDRRRALAAGFHSFAAKPIEPLILVSEIARLAARSVTCPSQDEGV